MPVVKQVAKLVMWYPLRVLVRMLPLRFTWVIGVGGGLLLHAISRRRQRAMAEEFRRILPAASPAEVARLVRESFVTYAVSEIEVLLYPVLTPARIARIARIEGREHLDAALAAGRGVLLFQAHFGAFQMTMPVIGHSGYTMSQVSALAGSLKDDAETDTHRHVLDIKERHELALPVHLIPVTGSLRAVFTALAANEIVGITVDGGVGKRPLALPFLGREAHFQAGGVDIALRTGAAILPAFIYTEGGIRHRLVIHPPIAVDPAARDQNRRQVLAEFARLLEGHVRRRPDHYGYTLSYRRLRASADSVPFFTDYGAPPAS